MENFEKIVLNIPHSSKVMPLNTWDGDIESEIEKWTDTYTDVLFSPNCHFDKIDVVACRVSRFFCDVERLLNDPLEKDGKGIFYTDFNGCHRSLDHELFSMVMQIWWEHQRLLSASIIRHCLVLDCHSFPDELAPEVDICIGFNDHDWSKPSLEFIEKVCVFFEGYGYRVALNNPYSNSITPHHDFPYKSLMIEVNKRLYLNPQGEKLGSMYKLNEALNYLYQMILE